MILKKDRDNCIWGQVKQGFSEPVKALHLVHRWVGTSVWPPIVSLHLLAYAKIFKSELAELTPHAPPTAGFVRYSDTIKCHWVAYRILELSACGKVAKRPHAVRETNATKCEKTVIPITVKGAYSGAPFSSSACAADLATSCKMQAGGTFFKILMENPAAP